MAHNCDCTTCEKIRRKKKATKDAVELCLDVHKRYTWVEAVNHEDATIRIAWSIGQELEDIHNDN